MKKDLQVLYITESESGIQELIQILEDVNFSVMPIWVNVNEVVSTSLKANAYGSLRYSSMMRYFA